MALVFSFLLWLVSMLLFLTVGGGRFFSPFFALVGLTTALFIKAELHQRETERAKEAQSKNEKDKNQKDGD